MRNSHYHKNMGYYSRHAIFLMDNDIQKLKTIQNLLEDKDIYFVIRKQTVYLENGNLMDELHEAGRAHRSTRAAG